jgi:hypothetical protein
MGVRDEGRSPQCRIMPKNFLPDRDVSQKHEFFHECMRLFKLVHLGTQ